MSINPERCSCGKCSGTGKYLYPDTSTWRSAVGIVAGRAMTLDICDKCWGSGDDMKPYTNMRAIEDKLSELKESRVGIDENGNSNRSKR